MFYAYNLPKLNSEESISGLTGSQVAKMSAAVEDAAEKQLARWLYAYGARSDEAGRWECLLEESISDLHALADRAGELEITCHAEEAAAYLLGQIDSIKAVY